MIIFILIICLINYFVSGHDLTNSQADEKFLDRIKISKQSPNDGKTAQLALTFSRDKYFISSLASARARIATGRRFPLIFISAAAASLKSDGSWKEIYFFVQYFKLMK